MPDVHEKAESSEPPSNNSDVALPNKDLGDISMERCFHSRLNCSTNNLFCLILGSLLQEMIAMEQVSVLLV